MTGSPFTPRGDRRRPPPSPHSNFGRWAGAQRAGITTEREMTCGPMTGIARPGGQHRVLLLADRLRDRAPGTEPAAHREPQRTRRVADHRRSLVVGTGRAGGELGNRGEQALGVRMPRIAEQLPGRRDLDDAAQVHDRDPIAQVPDHGEVVRDQQQREPEFVAQVTQQVEHGRLDAHVQRGDRLVGDQHVGAQHQRPGDRHPLPLATGELPGKRLHRVGAEADQREHLLAVLIGLARRHDVVHPNQLAQHAADGEPRVQRGVRVLEHHLDPALVVA